MDKLSDFFWSILAVLVVVLVVVLLYVHEVHAADFKTAYLGTIKPHERGFQKNPKDTGNYWKKKLIGTGNGISAATYGGELIKKGWDIRHLTDVQTMFFYGRDFWHLGDPKHDMSVLKSQYLADHMVDEIVNEGPGGGPRMLKQLFAKIEWLERHKNPSFSIPVRPAYERETFEWLNTYTGDIVHRDMVAREIEHYRNGFYIHLVSIRPALEEYVLGFFARADR